jgi:hypothetical protein
VFDPFGRQDLFRRPAQAVMFGGAVTPLKQRLLNQGYPPEVIAEAEANGMLDQMQEGIRAYSRANQGSTTAKRASRVGGGSGRRSGRAAAVKRVMAEQGLSLPQASKYVKDNNVAY